MYRGPFAHRCSKSILGSQLDYFASEGQNGAEATSQSPVILSVGVVPRHHLSLQSTSSSFNVRETTLVGESNIVVSGVSLVIWSVQVNSFNSSNSNSLLVVESGCLGHFRQIVMSYITSSPTEVPKLFIVNVGTLGSLEFFVGGHKSSVGLRLEEILPSSSHGWSIDIVWNPSKSNDESLSAGIAGFFVFLSDDWNEERASLELDAINSELHFLAVVWSASDLDRSVQPVIKTSGNPWWVYKFITLENIDRLGVNRQLPSRV